MRLECHKGVRLPTRAPMRPAAPWPRTTPAGTSMRGDDRWTSIRIEGRPLGQLAGHRACQWPPWTVSHIRSSPGLAALLDDQRAPHAGGLVARDLADDGRSEEHTSELQSLMRISYAVFCLNKK